MNDVAWGFAFLIVLVVCRAACVAWADYLDAKYPDRDED